MGIGGWSRTLRGWFGALWGRGQSETLSVVVLFGIIVILATVLGLFLFGDFGGDDEQLLANMQGNVTIDGITLEHEGGDAFDPENVEVLLLGDTETSLTIEDDFETEDGASEFAPGDSWEHTTNDSFYGGEFRLMVVHEPTNSVLLDQPHVLPITDVSLLVEDWRGEMRNDRADVFGNGSEYEFMVEVNAGDGEPPQPIPMSTGGSLSAASTGLDVNISVPENEYGMLEMQNTEGQTGNFTANWNNSSTQPYEDVVLEAELNDDQFGEDVILDDSDATTVRVLKKETTFTIDHVKEPSVTDEGDIIPTYNVTNVGLAPGNVTVNVTYKNDTTGNRLVAPCEDMTGTIDPGNSSIRSDEDCHFDNDGEYGDINVTVSVPTDGDSAVVTPEPPEFLVNITDAPAAVPANSEISVDANITNNGGVIDNQQIQLDGTNGSGYSDSNTTTTGNLTPGDSVLIEGLSVTAPGSDTNVTLNLSSDQNYDTATVEVQDVLIPIQTYEEWNLVGGFFTGNAASNTGASGTSNTEGSGSTVGTQRGTGNVGTQNSDLNATGENIAVVSPEGTTSPGRSRVDELLRNIINNRVPNADTVDLMRPSVSNFTSDMDGYNTFVVYRFAEDDFFGEPEAKTFTQELNDTQSVVYTSTNTGFTERDYANAVDTINDIRSDPGGYGEEPDGIRGAPLEITTSHPIWNNIGTEAPGYTFDTVDYDPSDTGVKYSAYFSSYSGEIFGEDVDSGNGALGVNDTPDNGSTEVLLTNAVPYQTIVEDDTVRLTDDAKTLLANAVKYAAASDGGGGGGGSANFQVETVDPKDSGVTAGDTLDVDVTVNNTGGVQGTQDVTLSVDDGNGFSQVETVQVPLDAGNVTTETLTYDTQSSDGPTLPVEAGTDNDSEQATADLSSTGGGTTDITYNVTGTRYNMEHPDDPDASPGSGEFQFQTGSDSASEAVVWEDYLAGENWIRFEYNSADLDEGVETNVSIGGTTKWSSSKNTGGDWEHRLVDIADAGDGTAVGFGLEIPASASHCSGACRLNYENVTFVTHSLPLQTAADWKRTAGTLDIDSGTAGFSVDSSTAATGTASGKFDVDGTASVVVRENLTGGDWLTFEYESSSFGELDVLAGGTTETTVTSTTGNWTTESVFLEESGSTRIEFELSCSSNCTFNLDNVRLEAPGPSIPVKTQEDWGNMSATFEATDDQMAFEVDDTNASVEGASGRFTAGEFASGVAQVTVTENLGGEDAFSFDYRGSDLGIAQVSAAVTIDNDTVWTSNGDPGGWTTERIDVSDYSGTSEIAFEMRVSTETLNREAIYFDNVTWSDLPGCSLDGPSYDSGTDDFELIDGDRSTCALEADASQNSDSLLSSSGLVDPQWFEPPRDGDEYPARDARISYDVKADSGTTAEFYFGDDPGTSRYSIQWNPGNEALTVAGPQDTSTEVGGSNGTDEYYRIIVDYDFDASQDTGVIWARAVNSSGDTVVHTGINDDAYENPGGIGFKASGPGTVVWDNLDYAATNFETVLPQPGESYYAYGSQQTADGPTGLAHDGGWVHDRLPVEEGETRTYNYYADVGTELQVSLRNGTATETESLSDIDNEIHRFSDRLDLDEFRAGQEVMVSLTIDYTDENEVEMRAKATVADGFTRELVQTWSGAASHDEIYVSTYEYDQPVYQEDSLRLITERTGPSAAAGYLYDPDVHPTGAAGYGHSGGWVDQNGPTGPGTIERIPYFAPSSSALSNDLRIQLRDEPASDQQRARDAGPVQTFGANVDNVLSVSESSYTILIFDYTVTGEVFLRATSLAGQPQVVGTAVVSLPDSAPDDLPIYLSTHEDTSNPDEYSVRYSPFG